MTLPRSQPSDASGDRGLYDKLDLLDRLEELLEEMQDLGVRTIEEIERRIAELDAEVGEQDLNDA